MCYSPELATDPSVCSRGVENGVEPGHQYANEQSRFPLALEKV